MKKYEGYEVIYISDEFFDVLEKYLLSISRHDGYSSLSQTIALRDEKAQLEFRRLSYKLDKNIK